jgi:signal peptidase I
VKRIIGLPGEEIVLLDARVYINGQPLSESYLREKPELEDTLPLKLGPDQYYVMGDNRNHSDDSRANGPISEADIRGRFLTRLWPLSRFGALQSPQYGS